jgi:hypothetical protein
VNVTEAYFPFWVERSPREADEKIKKPAITSMLMEKRKGMSTFIRFINILLEGRVFN